MGTLAVEARGNEAGVGEGDAGECDVAAPGELAGNEAGAGATAVDSPAGGWGVEPLGPPQAAGASFEEWGSSELSVGGGV